MQTKKQKFYITTAIDYPNSKPHLGHAYEKIIADCLARWHRLKGEKVFYLTGTDEHGKKIEQAAKAQGKNPKEFVDDQVKHFKQLCEKLDISNDRFIRTTEENHEKTCQDLFQKVLDKGDIYLGKYEGLYCISCEAFYLEKDLIEGKCPIHKKPLEKLSEESYFFKMNKYEKKLIELFENQDFIHPKRRKQEIMNRIKEGLKDLSVSRTSFSWGIPLKNNPKHVIYVWFDALLNYITGIDYPKEKFEEYWPADIHVIGKDILWFHSVIWPCMLFAMEIKPPKKILVHGFINSQTGEKLSKTTGNMVDPIEITEKYGTDTLRYYLLREIPLGEDGNFSTEALIKRHNNELADSLGNLVHRTLTLTEKKLDSTIPQATADETLTKKLNLEKIKEHMENLETHNALNEIFDYIGECNKYLNDKQPWKQEKKEAEKTLYTTLDSIRIISILINPFMPKTSEKIAKQLNCKITDLKEAKFNLLKPNTKIGKKEILFQKIKENTPKTTTKNIEFIISKELIEKGIKIEAAIIENVKIKKKHEGLEKQINNELKKLDIKEIEESEQTKEYEKMYENLKEKPKYNAITNLTKIVKESKKIPRINTAVDSYNIVSLKKGIVIGCHDLDKIEGNVKGTIEKQKEKFIAMNNQEQEVNEKEYVFKDNKGIICRMDVKQCERTKVTTETKNLFIYAQGNAKTPQKLVEEALNETIQNITKYCNGKAKKIEIKKE
ncbi:MAG: methionine--tRNA ligase [Candidatus Diapherotrites archaeon]